MAHTINNKDKLHIFICHYTKLVNRKTHILKQLNNLPNDKIVIHFIDDYDKEVLNDNIKKRFFNEDPDLWINKVAHYMNINNLKKSGPRKLRESEKSLALKHYIALKQVINLNINMALIIEDDCTFCDDFINKLNLYLYENIPTDWNCYFSNSFPGQHRAKNYTNINNDYIVKSNHPVTNGTYSYLINSNCCKRLVNEIENNKITLPIDFEYNWLFYKLNLNVYMNSNKDFSLTDYDTKFKSTTTR